MTSNMTSTMTSSILRLLLVSMVALCVVSMLTLSVEASGSEQKRGGASRTQSNINIIAGIENDDDGTPPTFGTEIIASVQFIDGSGNMVGDYDFIYSGLQNIGRFQDENEIYLRDYTHGPYAYTHQWSEGEPNCTVTKFTDFVNATADIEFNCILPLADSTFNRTEVVMGFQCNGWDHIWPQGFVPVTSWIYTDPTTGLNFPIRTDIHGSDGGAAYYTIWAYPDVIDDAVFAIPCSNAEEHAVAESGDGDNNNDYLLPQFGSEIIASVQYISGEGQPVGDYDFIYSGIQNMGRFQSENTVYMRNYTTGPFAVVEQFNLGLNNCSTNDFNDFVNATQDITFNTILPTPGATFNRTSTILGFPCSGWDHTWGQTTPPTPVTSWIYTNPSTGENIPIRTDIHGNLGGGAYYTIWLYVESINPAVFHTPCY